MGDFTTKLMQRRMLNRPGAPPVDLDDLRQKTPQEGLEALLSKEACSAIGTLDPAVAQEVGKLLVAMGDALARVSPPALRLDLKMASQGWVLEVLNQGNVIYSRSASMTPKLLRKLVVDGTVQFAHQAAFPVRDPAEKGKVYDDWAEEFAEQALNLEDWGVKAKQGDSCAQDNYCQSN